MNYKELANKAAMWGLILGVVMSLSKVVESALIITGDVTNYVYLSIEWIVVSIMYVYIIYRANKERAKAMPSQMGYNLRNVLNFTILISIFAAVIVGITTHIYIVNYIGGYDVYIQKSITSMAKIYSEVGVNENLESLLMDVESSVEAVRNDPPTILTTMMSAISSYIISGFILSLVLSIFIRRKPMSEI